MNKNILNSKWANNPVAFRILTELLFSATSTDYESKGWKIKRGQWKGSIEQLSIRTGLNYKTVHKWIKEFHEEGTCYYSCSKNKQTTIFTLPQYNYFMSQKPVTQQPNSETNTYVTNTHPKNLKPSNPEPFTYVTNTHHTIVNYRSCTSEEDSQDVRFFLDEKNTTSESKELRPQTHEEYLQTICNQIKKSRP